MNTRDAWDLQGQPALKSITVAFSGQIKTFDGRPAWALGHLIMAGFAGCTAITHPGPRWSDYVLKLRRAGLDIMTVREPHGGQFPGHHARYVLVTLIQVIDA